MRLSPRRRAWNCPVAGAIGASAGFFLSGGVLYGWPLFLIIIASAVAAGAGIVCLSGFTASFRRFGLFCLVLSSSLFFFTYLRITYDNRRVGESFGQPVESITEFTGRCLDDSHLSGTGRTMVRMAVTEVRSELLGTTSATATAVVMADGGTQEFSWGEVCTVHGRLLTSDPPGTWFLFPDKKGITANGWSSWIFRIRADIRSRIMHVSRSIDPNSLLDALFLGDKDLLDPSVYDLFLKSGSVHILALSGTHLGLVAVLLSMVLAPNLGKRKAFRIIIIILAYYIFIAGPKPSLIRAGLMTLVSWIYAELRRNHDPLVIPSTAFILYLIFDPSAAFSSAFQLSFLAVAGMIVLGPALNAHLSAWFPRPVAGSLSVSLAAQSLTIPVVAGTFGVYYPVGIIAGLILGPLTAVFLGIGITGIILSAFLPITGFILRPVLQLLYSGIIVVASVFSRFPAIML